MRLRKRALLTAALLTTQLGAVAVLASSARATTGPADDRQQTAPTSWWSYTGVTAAQLSARLTSNSARLTSLQVDNPSTPTFTAVMVRNSGTYSSGYWWYYGQTQAQVSSLLSSNHARLISASPYATGSGTRYAVVMVPNSGSNQKAWWWYIGSTSFLSSKLSANHARMIEVDPMPGSNDYLGLMVANTGSDATSWWWYVHASVSSLSSHLSANQARLVDLSRNADGTFNGVMYRNTGTRWYWYVNSAPATAVNRAVQQGERIIDANSYTVGGTKYYAVVETRNTNALSERLWNVIAPTIDSGHYGFYLKQVGGGTLAGVEQDTTYEPASALKVLYHAKSIHEESLGHAHDTDTITYHYHDLADPNDGEICPDDYATTTTTNLKNADQQMMWNSDNRMTKGVLAKYGKSAVLAYGASLGLAHTAINHDIGCPTASTHNRTTLVDLGKVYEAFQNGTITTSSTWKAQFRSRMLNESNYSGFRNSLCPIVTQEAAKLGKSSSVATSFCNAMTWIAKGGSYQYGGSLPYQVSWDGVSMTGLPYKSSGATAPRYFVFGEYVDGTTINTQSEANAINAARSKEFQEAMRPYVHAALATW